MDARTGRKTAQASVGTRGFGMGLLGPSTLCLIRHQGLHLLSLPGLEVTQTIPLKRFFQGFIHIQGSAVLGGQAYLVNGDKMVVVSLAGP